MANGERGDEERFFSHHRAHCLVGFRLRRRVTQLPQTIITKGVAAVCEDSVGKRTQTDPTETRHVAPQLVL